MDYNNERKQAEQALRESEEKYRLLAENSEDVIWTMNAEWQFTYVSPSIKKLRGYTAEEVMSRPMEDSLTPESLKIVQGAIQMVQEKISRGSTYIEPLSYELEQPCKDGSTVWTEALVRILFDEHGQYTGCLGYSRNISERKLAQQRAEQHTREQLLVASISEKLVGLDSRDDVYSFIGEQIFNLTENARLIITQYDSDRQALTLKTVFGTGKALSTFQKDFGFDPFKIEVPIQDYTEEELRMYKNRRLNFFPNRGIHLVSGRNISRKVSRAIEHSVGIHSVYLMGITWNEKLYGTVAIFLKKHGLLTNIPLIETIINQASVAIQRLYTSEELAKSERRYRTLVEMSPDGIGLLDASGQLVSCNQEMVKIFGFDKEEELIKYAEKASGFVALKDKLRSVKNIRRRGEGREFPIQVCTMVRKNGTEFPAEVKTVVVDDESGKSKLLLSIIRDITERRQTEEALERYNEQLRNFAAHNEMVREKERLSLARDIHDILGSSMAGLKMELAVLKQLISEDILKSHPAIPQQLGFMSEQIDESVEIMRKIVRELRPGILDELGLIEAIRWYAGEIEKRSGILCKLNIHDKEINISSRQSIIIYRIFQEILTNVILHARATKVVISVSYRKSRILQLKISDNGIGISDGAINRPDSFGLLGMRERAILLDGRLNIKGNKGSGTAVTLEIPVNMKKSRKDHEPGETDQVIL